MSTTTPPPPPPLAAVNSPSKSSSSSLNLNSVGLGYAIAIALGFLVLFSTLLLASYICCRTPAARRRRVRHAQNQNPNPNPNPNPNSNENSIYLPRIIFVAEDDDDENESSQSVVVGLDQAAINSYPKFVYSKRNWNNNDVVCSICLCEYRENEMMRMLPDCRHCFHLMCVDAWLKLNASCPVCRSSPLPTPLSTPLQEVVPLSQYADGRRRQ